MGFEIPADVADELRARGVDPDAPVDLDALEEASDPMEIEPELPRSRPQEIPFEDAIGKFRADATETSRKAAINVYFRSGTQKHVLLTLIGQAGERGMICDTAERITGLPHQSASPRWNELWKDHKLIAPSGHTFVTRAGGEADAFILTEEGRKVLAEYGGCA